MYLRSVAESVIISVKKPAAGPLQKELLCELPQRRGGARLLATGNKRATQNRVLFNKQLLHGAPVT